MSDTWQPIILSAKVFGHLAQGLYRTPAGAIKELISNSFDADAKLVRIHTDFPRFETFSCEDNGTGMSRDEFRRLMNHGIGSSYKRTNTQVVTKELKRPLIGRLGLGILSLAQICTQFDLVSHHEESKSAFSATIKFPPYTREEMDKIIQRSGEENELIRGGEYQFVEEEYDPEKKGLRVFTKYLREQFRKRMKSLENFSNNKILRNSGPYKSFENYLKAIYTKKEVTRSLVLCSDYDQLLFGLALSPPLPFVEENNFVVQIPTIKKRQRQLRNFNFEVQVDNITLANPLCLPAIKEDISAERCHLKSPEKVQFQLVDGPFKEICIVTRRVVMVDNSDLKFNLYEIDYSNQNVAGSPLEFNGYVFQQTGRLYPLDIQGVVIRLQNVAIGKYDNNFMSHPYAEGPRFSMVSSEIFVHRGFEDALNIDRDSFNELHPHYIRVQSYFHRLLHDRIFPETWGEEKKRNLKRRDERDKESQSRFVEVLRKTTGDTIRSIRTVEKTVESAPLNRPAKVSPVEFEAPSKKIEVDQTHPLLKPLLRRKKHASLIENLVVAFERSNKETTIEKRRELFYKLLTEIFSSK